MVGNVKILRKASAVIFFSAGVFFVQKTGRGPLVNRMYSTSTADKKQFSHFFVMLFSTFLLKDIIFLS